MRHALFLLLLLTTLLYVQPSYAQAEADAVEELDKEEPVKYDAEKAVVVSKRDASGINLYVYVEEEEEAKQLTDTAHTKRDPVFSHKRDRIAYIQITTRADEENPEGVSIKVMEADGTEDKTVYTAPMGTSIMGLSWSPTGNSLVFSERRLKPITQESIQKLLAKQQAEFEKKQKENPDEEATMDPIKAYQLWQPPLIMIAKSRDESGTAIQVGFGANPSVINSDTLVFTQLMPSEESKQLTYQLATMPVGGGEVILLEKENATMSAASPDGRRIAYIKLNGRRMSLFISDSDGRNEKQVAGGGYLAVAPQWSADSKTLYYTRYVKGRMGEVWRMNSDGSDKEKVGEGYTGSVRAMFYLTGNKRKPPRKK